MITYRIIIFKNHNNSSGFHSYNFSEPISLQNMLVLLISKWRRINCFQLVANYRLPSCMINSEHYTSEHGSLFVVSLYPLYLFSAFWHSSSRFTYPTADLPDARLHAHLYIMRSIILKGMNISIIGWKISGADFMWKSIVVSMNCLGTKVGSVGTAVLANFVCI